MDRQSDMDREKAYLEGRGGDPAHSVESEKHREWNHYLRFNGCLRYQQRKFSYGLPQSIFGVPGFGNIIQTVNCSLTDPLQQPRGTVAARHEDGHILHSQETWPLIEKSATLERIRERPNGEKQIQFCRRQSLAE
jgi:hypothetical protein